MYERFNINKGQKGKVWVEVSLNSERSKEVINFTKMCLKFYFVLFFLCHCLAQLLENSFDLIG